MLTSGLSTTAVSRNALFLMSLTEQPMVTEVRLLHPWNALSPMLVTESGMVTEVKSAAENA